jgi:hypothetical protein
MVAENRGGAVLGRSRTPEKVGDCREIYLIQPYRVSIFGGYATGRLTGSTSLGAFC